MEKYSDILQFARDLYLHQTGILVSEESRMTLNPPRFIRAAGSTLECFTDAFCDPLSEMFKKNSSKIGDTEEQFMRYVIPRCLKLVEDENYHFSFMMVAAFIEELAYKFEYERNCHLFSMVTYKCLAAVFKRRFEDGFKRKGGWKGLRAYCDGVNRMVGIHSKPRLVSKVLTGFDRPYRKHVLKLISECDVVDDENFALNSYELLLNEIDDVSTLEAELSIPNAATESSPLQVELTVLEDHEEIKESPNFDSEDVKVTSTCVQNADNVVGEVQGSGDEGVLVLEDDIPYESILEDPDDYSDDSECSDSDSDTDTESTSTSVSDISALVDAETLCEGFSEHIAYLLQRKDYYKKLSDKTCKSCNKKCFQIANYLFLKHRDLSLKPEKLRRTKFVLTRFINVLRKLFRLY